MVAIAQPNVEIRVALSSKAVSLGEPFHLFLSVSHQPGLQAKIPANLYLGPDIEVLAVKASPGQGRDKRPVRVFDVKLMAFVPGELRLPEIPITITGGGLQRTQESASITVFVSGVIADEKPSLKGPTSPVRVYQTDQRIVVAGLVALAVAALLALAILLRRVRKRSVAHAMRMQAPESPKKVALARLRVIEASGVIDSADRRTVYVELSEVVRGYLAAAFGVPALDLTTAEIAAELQARGHEEIKKALVAWLEEADLVKFAGFRASPDDARQALYDVRLWIEKQAESIEGGTGA